MNKYSGYSEGSIYTYRWLYSTLSIIHKCEELGSVRLGLTSVTLTAFMMESYLNHVCQEFFDYFARVEKFLDDTNDDFIRNFKMLDQSKSFNENVAVFNGYYDQFEKLKSILLKTVNKKKREKLESVFQPTENANNDFGAIDKEFHFSPISKFRGVLECIDCEDVTKIAYKQIIGSLFEARNSLAHGRTEHTSDNFEFSSIEPTKFDSKMIPKIDAEWQKSCSPEAANKFFKESVKIIECVHLGVFNSCKPFIPLESQFSAVQLNSARS